jgi:O-antigen ligase
MKPVPEPAPSAAPAVELEPGLRALHFRAIWREFLAQPALFKVACAYTFFEYVRPQTIYPAADFIPWTMILILLGCAMTVLDRHRTAPARTVITPMLLAYVAVVILSGLFAFLPIVSLRNWDHFVPWVLVYFFLINAVKTRTQVYLFLLLYLLWSFKMAQHGFRSWASYGFGSRKWGVAGAPGWFENSGEFGIQMCIFLPLTLAFWLALRPHLSRLKSMLLLVLPICAAGSVIASNSRGAVIGAAGALFWLGTGKGSRLKGILILGVVGFVAYSLIPPEFLQRFDTAGKDANSVLRLTYWRDGVDIMKHHPVLGVGYFNWLPYYDEYYGAWLGGRRFVQLPHNIFVQAGAEGGLLGLGLILGLIASTFVVNRQTRRIAERNGDTFVAWTSRGFDAGMIGFLISAQFVTVLYYPYLWIALAMTAMLRTCAGAPGDATRDAPSAAMSATARKAPPAIISQRPSSQG